MTVAAGFVCNNGIVLGADSEITHSETSKTNESKIIRIHPSGDVFLTYSGDTYFVRDLVARLRFFVEESGEKVTADDCLSLIRSLYEANVDKVLAETNEKSYWTELLVLVRRDKRHLYKAELEYETVLYHLNGRAMIRVDRYAVIGIGADIGRTVCENRYSQFARVYEAALTMIDAIRRVKASVPGVGGRTTVMAITGDPDFFLHDFGNEEIRQVESDCEFLDGLLKYVYEWLPQSLPGDPLEQNLERLMKKIGDHRNSANRIKVSF